MVLPMPGGRDDSALRRRPARRKNQKPGAVQFAGARLPERVWLGLQERATKNVKGGSELRFPDKVEVSEMFSVRTLTPIVIILALLSIVLGWLVYSTRQSS